MKCLIEKGANLDAQHNNGETCLYCACLLGYLNAVQLLLNHGADVTLASSEGITPLVIASQVNHVNVVWFLVRHYPWLVIK